MILGSTFFLKLPNEADGFLDDIIMGIFQGEIFNLKSRCCQENINTHKRFGETDSVNENWSGFSHRCSVSCAGSHSYLTCTLPAFYTIHTMHLQALIPVPAVVQFRPHVMEGCISLRQWPAMMLLSLSCSNQAR